MILDTTFLIDLLRNKKDAVQYLNKLQKPLVTTSINKYELLVGITRIPGIDLEKKLNVAKRLFDKLTILELDDKSTLEAAKICGLLLQNGIEIRDNDCLIAGIAKRNGIDSILTKNSKHFERISNFKAISY